MLAPRRPPNQSLAIECMFADVAQPPPCHRVIHQEMRNERLREVVRLPPPAVHARVRCVERGDLALDHGESGDRQCGCLNGVGKNRSSQPLRRCVTGAAGHQATLQPERTNSNSTPSCGNQVLLRLVPGDPFQG